jgi:hypothetical protein
MTVIEIDLDGVMANRFNLRDPHLLFIELKDFLTGPMPTDFSRGRINT